MSAAGRRPPQTDQELMRDFNERIRALEHPGAARVGKWVLSTGPAGDLVASYVGGGSVILSPPPQVGDSPDEVDTAEPLPSISVGLTSEQAIPNDAVTGVHWDTVLQSRGEWGGGPWDSVEIPEAGQYLLVLNTRWKTRTNRNTLSTLKVDVEDVTVEQAPARTSSPNAVVTALRWLPKGSVIGSWVFADLANALVPGSRLDVSCLVREGGVGDGR